LPGRRAAALSVTPAVEASPIRDAPRPSDPEETSVPGDDADWVAKSVASEEGARQSLAAILAATPVLETDSDEEVAEDPSAIFQAIHELCDLPTLASLANTFRHWMGQPDQDLERFLEVVRADPVLVLEILKVSQSAYYALDVERLSLEHCVAYLGTQHIRLMATSIAARTQLSEWNQHYNWQPLWMHGYAVAVVADDLRRAFRLGAMSDLHIAALLHDIGKVILSAAFPRTYGEILNRSLNENTPLVELERERFSLDHEEVGALYARRHHFPPSIEEAIRRHNEPGESGKNAEMIALIQVANHVTHALGLGYSGSRAGILADFWETPGWEILRAKNTRTAAKNTPEVIRSRLLRRQESWRAELRRLFA
jgi:putative nucleotidyltransferase with HDIG domain